VDALQLIKNAGFDCYFTTKTSPEEVSRIVERGNTLGLFCEAIHAPFLGGSKMWLSDTEDGEKVFKELMSCIDLAVAVGAHCVVIHSSSVATAHGITERGILRYDELVRFAGEKNVNIAFENLLDTENLLYFIERYKHMAHVGFCYDFGHENCFTPGFRWMEHFRDKVFTTHIHDNFGPLLPEENGDIYSADTHLLPFEADINFSKCIFELNQYHYQGALVLETSNYPCEGPKATKTRDLSVLSNEEYLSLAYERLKRVSEL
jgi:sugar phosphate isomerase/epimerase